MYHIKNDPRSIQSGNMLYESLLKRIYEKEFEFITIKEVVEAAKLGRSTFYRNFDKLEDILQWKCDEAFRELSQYIVQSLTISNSPTSAEKFPFLLPFFRYWQTNTEILELLIAANRLDIIFSAFSENMKKLIFQFQPFISEAHLKIEYFLALRSGGIIHLLLQWIKNKKDLTPEELYNIVLSQSEGFKWN